MAEPLAHPRTVRRLARMPRAELQHRLAVAARRRLGWLPWAAGVAPRADGWVRRTVRDVDARAGLPAYLRRTLAARVYGPGWTPARLAEGLVGAGAADRILAEADELLAGRVRVLAYGPRHLGAPIDWHRDPVTAFAWPRRYWGRIVRRLQPGLDLKVVWEPSRHQHLGVLGAAAALTGDHRYADAALAQLESWIAQNPTGLGVHWLEALECGLRVLAWLWTLPLVLSSPRATPELCAAVLRSLAAQTAHVAANLSLYSSPNTHLLGEALALFIVGTVLPQLDAAGAWRARGQAILERELDVQVGEDGVYREASLYYHAYTVEFYLLAVVVAERNGIRLGARVRARLERMLEALAWLTRPDGTLPNVGDADGGRAVRLGAPSLVRVPELLATGAVLFERAELRAGLPSRGEEAAWLWPDGVGRLQRLGAAAPPHGCHEFGDARLAVERHRAGGDERWALLDAGDLGMLSGGHGHAGCLGLELYAHGRPLIVDRGTYVYNGAEAWRRYFRGTRAHSTVVVDGREQAEYAGNFRWATRYHSRLVRRLQRGPYAVLSGEHDAYRRLPSPVHHRRTLISVGGEYWLCVDVLTGDGVHTGEFLFHLAPELEVERDGPGIFAAPGGGADGLQIVGAGFEDPVTCVTIGATDPIQGWHSDDYGDKRPAPTLVTADTLRLPAVRVHLLAPGARAARLRVEGGRAGEGVALRVHREDVTDLLLAAPAGDRTLAAHGLELSGELVHARLGRGGELKQILAIEARRLLWEGKPLQTGDGQGDLVLGRDNHAADLERI